MKIKVTHYGEPDDPYSDTNSANWIGNHGNQLTISSCALTISACHELGLQPKDGALLKIVFSNRLVMFRTHDDTAPESDPRVDLFDPFKLLPPNLPDYADVTVIEVT